MIKKTIIKSTEFEFDIDLFIEESNISSIVSKLYFVHFNNGKIIDDLDKNKMINIIKSMEASDRNKCIFLSFFFIDREKKKFIEKELGLSYSRLYQIMQSVTKKIKKIDYQKNREYYFCKYRSY